MLAADGSVTADTVLAKHDENYMPKEVVDALKAQGVWKEGEGTRNDAARSPSPSSATTRWCWRWR